MYASNPQIKKILINDIVPYDIILQINNEPELIIFNKGSLFPKLRKIKTKQKSKCDNFSNSIVIIFSFSGKNP